MDCIKTFWDTPNYRELVLYYYKTFKYPLVQENDQCVMEIYTDYYWELIREITYSRYIAIGGALATIFI
jgi:hypothetical protein